MKNNKEEDSLIESYLDGSLAEEARIKFEKSITEDADLKRKFSARIALQEAWVKSAQHEDLKQHIKLLIMAEKHAHSAKRNTWLVAASLFILVGIGSLVISKNLKEHRNSELVLSIKAPVTDTKENILQGQKNTIKEYGSIDFSNENESILYNHKLPRNGSIYQASDTITFIWPSVSTQSEKPLLIFNNAGEKVIEIKLKNGDIGYKLMPSRLEPGNYTYVLEPRIKNYKFTINK
jgi:hypothetical protein